MKERQHHEPCPLAGSDLVRRVVKKGVIKFDAPSRSASPTPVAYTEECRRSAVE